MDLDKLKEKVIKDIADELEISLVEVKSAVEQKRIAHSIGFKKICLDLSNTSSSYIVPKDSAKIGKLFHLLSQITELENCLKSMNYEAL